MPGPTGPAPFTPGALTTLALVVGNTSTPMAYISESLGEQDVHLEREGLRGTRSHYAQDIRLGPQHVGGAIVLEPSPAELAIIAALAIGPGGNAAESLTAFHVVINRNLECYQYGGSSNGADGCYLDGLKLEGRQGGILRATLEIVAQQELANTGSVGSVNSAPPYIFSDIALTLQGNSRETESFDLEIHNHIDKERFLNYTTLPEVVPLDRTVTLATKHPYNAANQALLNQAIAGAAGSLNMNDAGSTNTSSTFTFPAFQVPYRTPAVPGKREVIVELNGHCRRTSGNAEITFSQP
jgi:hypothetical protein